MPMDSLTSISRKSDATRITRMPAPTNGGHRLMPWRNTPAGISSLRRSPWRCEDMPASSFREQLQRLPDAVGDCDAFRQLLHRGDGLLVAVAEREEGVQNVARRRRRAMDAGARRDIQAELVL